MAILNRASDGLPNVLVILVRTLRKMGPMERERLEALVAPPTLGQISEAFERDKIVRKTLNRWVQNGLFEESEGTIQLAAGYETGPTEGVEGIRALGAQLRKLALSPTNNEDLLKTQPGHTADFVHALCWMLAQDPFHLTAGSYEDLVNRMESDQFAEEPWAFRNDTRWDGFVDWAPLLGFGWKSRVPKSGTFITDPTPAVSDALLPTFGEVDELPVDDFLRGLARELPVLDGGEYRTQVEGRLVGNTWRPIKDHEISPTLSLSLLRLHEAGHLVLDKRDDAQQRRSLLGQGFKVEREVSHLRLPRTL